MKYKINLMPRKETPLLERLVYFSLNYLRYIIVITQLVVIGVFFYRFQIDQRIIDLKDAVDQKKEIVQIVLPLLNEASRIDKKTTQIENIIKIQNDFQGMLKYLLSVFPQTASLDTLEISSTMIKLTGSATDPRHLQAFYALLKKDQRFTDVQFQNIKKSDNGYDFTMTLSNFKN